MARFRVEHRRGRAHKRGAAPAERAKRTRVQGIGIGARAIPRVRVLGRQDGQRLPVATQGSSV